MDLFISYKSEEREHAYKIMRFLASNGVFLQGIPGCFCGIRNQRIQRFYKEKSDCITRRKFEHSVLLHSKQTDCKREASFIASLCCSVIGRLQICMFDNGYEQEEIRSVTEKFL